VTGMAVNLDEDFYSSLTHFFFGFRPQACHLAGVFLIERYIVKPTGVSNLWCVWDRSHGVVFGAEALSKEQAEALARSLNEAWRRTQ
jgi:hypothetical protein